MFKDVILSGRPLAVRLFILALAAGLVGCQMATAVSVQKLEEHRETADLSGLRPVAFLQDLKVSWAMPGQWGPLPVKANLLYTHMQLRSPTMATGVGVARIQLPLALPASAIVWFAKNEYLKRSQDDQSGRLIGQWSDSLGRQWFEAENSKYHVRGYAMTSGSEAWIVYSGYRVTQDRQPQEIALAEKSVQSVVPSLH